MTQLIIGLSIGFLVGSILTFFVCAFAIEPIVREVKRRNRPDNCCYKKDESIWK
jgi:membrane protein DedA with SNARE-associated domain